MAADHGGYELKNILKDYLEGKGHEIINLGTDSPESVDYPDYAKACCTEVVEKRVDFGILVCGSGVGISIAANKIDGSPFLNVQYRMITEEYDKALREIGCGFSAWTVDTEDEIVRFLKMGVSNITTRKPVLAMKLRKEIQGI